LLKCFYFFNGKVESIDEKKQIVVLDPDNIKPTDILCIDRMGFKYDSSITYYGWVRDNKIGEYIWAEKTTGRYEKHHDYPSLSELIKDNVKKPDSGFYRGRK
jgi:hypothetical protein